MAEEAQSKRADPSSADDLAPLKRMTESTSGATTHNSPAMRAMVTPPAKGSVAGSTFLVMGASVLAVLFGFGREIILAHYYGTHSEMDAFLNASIIPGVLFGVL